MMAGREVVYYVGPDGSILVALVAAGRLNDVQAFRSWSALWPVLLSSGFGPAFGVRWRVRVVGPCVV